jgi:hypothetical protein
MYSRCSFKYASATTPRGVCLRLVQIVAGFPRREKRSSSFHTNDDTFRIQSGYHDHPKAIPSGNHPLAYEPSLETRVPVGVCGARQCHSSRRCCFL